MKRLVLISLLALSACAEKPKDLTNDRPLAYLGSALQLFHDGLERPAFNGLPIVEASLINNGKTIEAFVDIGMQGSFARTDLGPKGTDFTHFDPLQGPKTNRFSYVLFYNGMYYKFIQSDNNIYMLKSSTGVDWDWANGFKPVLNQSPNPRSIYNQIWNVGATVDDSGVWHMLIECADGSGAATSVGLAYSTGVLNNNSIDFNVARSSTHVIPNGGNPWLQFIPGKGILAFYGVYAKPQGPFKDEWYISAGILPSGSNTWVPKSNFAIGSANIHVADPHAVDLPGGGSMLVISFDQDRIYESFSTKSLSEIYDLLW